MLRGGCLHFGPLFLGSCFFFSLFGPHALLTLLHCTVAGDQGTPFSCGSLVAGLYSKIGRDRRTACQQYQHGCR